MTNGSEKIKENLGINMKKYKKALKLTQRELGIQIDVTESYIRFLEKGTRKPSVMFLGNWLML